MKTIFTKSDGNVTLTGRISDDRLKIFIDATIDSRADKAGSASVQPNAYTRDTLLSLLQGAVPEDRLHLEVIADIAAALSRGESVTERRIAKGIEPVAGADGKVVLLVRKLGGAIDLGGEESTDRSPPVRALHSFDNVRRGMAVARMYPPRSGEDGMDALGRPLKAPAGKPAKIALDKSLVLESAREPGAAYQEIISQADGYLAEDGGSLSVREDLVIKGNLDHRYGSIDFIGSVSIQGDVLPGFAVVASKSVQVKGSVRGAKIATRSGDVSVQGFVFGGDWGQITCAGNFHCRTAQEAKIDCRGMVSVEREIIDSSVRALGTVEVKRGALVGGHTFSGCGMEADTIGTESGTETCLYLSSDIETTSEYAAIAERLASHEKALKLLELHLGPYASNRTRIVLLKPDHRKKMEEMLKKLDDVSKSRVMLLDRKQKLMERAKVNSRLQVNFRKFLHEGVQVRVGDVVYKPPDTVRGPQTLEFVNESSEFKLHELVALQCELVPKDEKTKK